MKTENLLNIRIFGFKSLRGYYGWLKICKNLLFKKQGLTFGERMWCLTHGFDASYYRLVGAEEMKANYPKYLTNKEYYKMHPINGDYSFWIDDKMTTKHIFSKYNDYLPKYYFQIEEKQILRLPDCTKEYPTSAEGVLECLDEVKDMAVKRLVGSCGVGFYRFEKRGDAYYVLGKETSREEMKKLISELNGYLVMEFLENCEELQAIWPNALNTMRMLYAQVDGEIKLLRSYIRFGTTKSHGVDNVAQGGIMCDVDVKTGCVWFAFEKDKNGYASEIKVHPDTQVPLQFKIPCWEEINQKLVEITKNYAQLSYLGYDVAMTKDGGFRIVEVNSLTSCDAAQVRQPYLANEETTEIFRKFGLKR